MNKRKYIYIYIGALAAFILSSLFHFAYESFGEPKVAAGLFPIGESIWEHMKLPFYSLLFVNLIPWCEFVRRLSVKDRFVLASFQSEIAILVIFFGYYGLKGGFRLEGLPIDLTLLFIGMILGLWISARLVKERTSGKDAITFPVWAQVYLIIKLITMPVLFYWFSFSKPVFPLFIE